MVVDNYPTWKVDALVRMKANIATIEDSKKLMGDLKNWTKDVR